MAVFCVISRPPEVSAAKHANKTSPQSFGRIIEVAEPCADAACVRRSLPAPQRQASVDSSVQFAHESINILRSSE